MKTITHKEALLNDVKNKLVRYNGYIHFNATELLLSSNDLRIIANELDKKNRNFIHTGEVHWYDEEDWNND